MKLLNMDEASEYLRLSKNTLYAWVSQKRIRYVKIGRRTMFDLKDLDEFIENNKTEISDFWR